ncbi:hypothetical protein ACUY4R_000840 [Kosakonia sp. BK9b]|uniref:hypothetical protein n=1 Tax=Kosakonia sp. TaxID=1916651 RepID=UPI00289BE31E|nr:hypothetical protein [Kosakonia sp.]
MLMLCPLHKKAEWTRVSCKVKALAQQGCPPGDYQFCYVTVLEMDNGVATRQLSYLFEKEDVIALGLTFSPEVIIVDRDKTLKQQNDRQLSLKLRQKLVTLCDDCFSPVQLYLNAQGICAPEGRSVG